LKIALLPNGEICSKCQREEINNAAALFVHIGEWRKKVRDVLLASFLVNWNCNGRSFYVVMLCKDIIQTRMA